MRFSIVAAAIALVGASTTLASAIPLESRQTTLCSGATGTPVCCATDVLGLADLDCAPPPKTPTSPTDFTNVCASIGQRARCCLLPVLGQALVCAAPIS